MDRAKPSRRSKASRSRSRSQSRQDHDDHDYYRRARATYHRAIAFRIVRRQRPDRQQMKSLPLIMTSGPLLAFALMHMLSCPCSGANVFDAIGSSIRKLAVGDFTELNRLVKPAILQLQDMSIGLDMGRATIGELRCTSFQIGDITMSSNRDTARRVSIPINIIDLDMECEFNYWYQTALIFTGSGSAKVISTGNDISSRMILFSRAASLSAKPPETAVFDRCEANIFIDSMRFQGGIAAWIANTIEGRLRPKIAAGAKAKLCKALQDWGGSINEQLDQMETFVAKYPPTYVNNPLVPEQSLDPPDFITLLNLRDKDGSMAKYVHQALDEAVDYLRGKTYDLDNIYPGPGPVDMNINVFVRNQLLDANRALNLDASEMSFLGANGLLWEGTDKLTKTSILLKSMKVKGLDTFTKFDPLNYIGEYSVQNEISWDYLELECDVTFIIRPSDSKDSVLDHPNPNMRVVETANLSLRLDNVSAALSLLLAIDRGLLETVEIGSLLRMGKISPCLLSTIFDVAIAGLSIDMDDIEPPTLSGFVSPGLDRVFGGASEAAFAIFKDLLLARLPTFFDLTVRDYINSNIIEKYWTYAENEACSWTSSGVLDSKPDDGTIDLRDLLLSPENALEAGASGKEPYGDLFSSLIMPMINDKLVSVDSDGLPLLNDHVVRPLTAIQSGSEGMLRFGTDLFAIESASSFHSSASSSTLVQMRASNFTIENLDTISDPVTLLNPISPHSLNNQIALGPVPRKPLLLSSKVVLAVSGEDSPLKMYNDLEIQLSLPSSELLFDIFAAIREDRLLSFPLRDVDNYHCWLDTVLPVSTMNNGTVDMSTTTEDIFERLPLDLSRLFVTLSSELRLAGRCIDCSSSGLLALNDILTHIQNAGLSKMLGMRLERLVEEIIWGVWQEVDLASMLLEAPFFCPHSPTYDENKLLTQTTSPIALGASDLSRDAMETIAGVCALAAEAGFVVAAKSHQPDMVSFADPLSAQQELDSNTSSNQFINLKNTDAIVGEKIMTALASASDYLRDEVDDDVTGDRDLGFNIAMRRFFLDEDSGLTIPLDVSVNIGGSDFYIDSLRVNGLDSVSTIGTLMQPIASQTLSSSITFDRLQFAIDIRVDSAEVKAEQEIMTISFGLRDVAVDLSLLFAADEKELGLLELGSLLHFHKIPKCLLSHVAEAKLTQLVVKAGSVDAPQVGDGFLSTKYQYDLNAILSSTHDEFYDDILAGLPLMFDDTVRKLLNQAIAAQLSKPSGDVHADCRWTDDLIDTGLIDFRDLFLTEEGAKAQGGRGTSPFGDLLRIVYQNLNTRVLSATSINSYIRSWTKDQSGVEGSAWYEGDMFNSSASVKVAGFRGEAEIILADPMVENLDSVIDPLAFMEPIPNRHNELRNFISFGDGQKRFHVGARATVALSDGDRVNVRNEIDVGLSLTSFSYLLQFFLNIPTSRLYQFPLQDFFNINCWLAAILLPSEDLVEMGSAGVIDQELQASGFDVDIACVSCSSPRFDELLVHLYSPAEKIGGDDKESVADDEGDTILDTAISSLLGGGFLRDRLLAEASMHCPHNDAYNPEAKWGEALTAPVATTEAEKAEKAVRDRKAMWFNAAMAIITGIVMVIVVTAKLLVLRKHKNWVQSLDDEGYAVFRQQEAKEEDTEKVLKNEMHSLFKSTAIPWQIRWGVPLAVLANVALFAGGHFAIISSVDLTGHVAGEPFYIKEFLSFSFIASIVRTYENGGNEMAILMLIFSGMYPYLKLVMLALAWVLPPRLLGGVKQRGSILLWMDVLAKLSVIDIVTMLLLAATVLVFVGGPAKALSPETSDFYAVEAIVTPAAGFYCFVMAQRISRIASKYLLEWHHRVVSLATKELDLRTALPPTDATILTSVSTIPFNPSSQDEESKGGDDAWEDQNAYVANNTGSVAPWSNVSISSCSKTAALSPADDNESTLRSLGWSNSNESSDERRPVPIARRGMSLSSAVDDDFTEASRSSSQLGRKGFIRRLARFGGIAGAVFSAITVCSVFVIGIVIGPSIKLDTRSLWSLALESGQSFKEAIQSSFFRTISTVLLQARFIMRSSEASYIGLLLLFCLVGISSILFPLTQAIIKLGRWQRRRKRRKKLGLPKQKSVVFPHYVKRLYLWKGMDVYIISFIIALWQLGAVSAYVIHLYCSLLEKLFSGLAYVGLAEASEAQCFRTQASLPLTVFIICASFVFLLVSFYLQASAHYKSNIRRVESMIANDKSIRRSLHSRGLSKVGRSSSFWNLGGTQLVDIGGVEEEEEEDVESEGQQGGSDASVSNDEEAPRSGIDRENVDAGKDTEMAPASPV